MSAHRPKVLAQHDRLPMSEFQQVRSKRRGPAKGPAVQDEQDLLEARVKLALTKVEEFESQLRSAWGDLWHDLSDSFAVSPLSEMLVDAEKDDQAISLKGIEDDLNRLSVVQRTQEKDPIEGELATRATMDPPWPSLPATEPTGPRNAARDARLKRRILSLGLGKPASDRTAQHQLALLLLMAKDLGIRPQDIEIFDPLWDPADVKVIRHFEMSISSHNLRGVHRMDLDTSAYVLYMPHCPRPLYEAILVSNWAQLAASSDRWVLLGNELLDYLPHSAVQRDEGMTVVKTRKARRVRVAQKLETGPKSALERLTPYLTCETLPPPPSGMEHSFASLRIQFLTAEQAASVDWASQLPAAVDVRDEAGEVISRDLPFAV